MKFLRAGQMSTKGVRIHRNAHAPFTNDDERRIEGYAERLRSSPDAYKLLPPIRIDQDGWLVQGRRRWEAHRRAKAPSILFVKVRYDDATELEEDQIRENLDRGHLTKDERDHAVARLVAIKRHRFETDGLPAGAEKGAPLSQAIVETAAEADLSVSSVKRIVAGSQGPTTQRGVQNEPPTASSDATRGAAADAASSAAAPEPLALELQEPPPPPIDTFGLDVDPRILVDAEQAQAVIDKVDLLLRQAQAALRPLEEVGSFPHARFQRLRELVHTAAAAVRASRPSMVCMFCKAQGIKTCHRCGGLGLGYEEDNNGAPKPLLLRADQAVVAMGGEYRLVSEVNHGR